MRCTVEVYSSLEAILITHSFRIFALVCALGLQSQARTTGRTSTDLVRLESVTIGERGTELLITFGEFPFTVGDAPAIAVEHSR